MNRFATIALAVSLAIAVGCKKKRPAPEPDVPPVENIKPASGTTQTNSAAEALRARGARHRRLR